MLRTCSVSILKQGTSLRCFSFCGRKYQQIPLTNQTHVFKEEKSEGIHKIRRSASLLGLRVSLIWENCKELVQNFFNIVIACRIHKIMVVGEVGGRVKNE